MDCNMPEMDGYECTQRIRKLIHEFSSVQPIISAVTGHTEQAYVDRAVESGMNQVISKPVNPNILKNLIIKLEFPLNT